MKNERNEDTTKMRDILSDYPVSSHQMLIYCRYDAFYIQTCSISLQEHLDGLPEPFGHWPRSLTQAVCSYSMTMRKCLAVGLAIFHLRPYSEQGRLSICKDHLALHGILKSAYATGIITRWRLGLSKYDFEVIHRPGVKHQAAETRLYLETNGLAQRAVDVNIQVLLI